MPMPTAATPLPEPSADEPSVAEAFELAMRAHSQGDVSTARAAYARLCERMPDNPDAWHLAGVLEGQYGHGDDAVRLIQRALAMDASQAMFHNNLGNLYARATRRDEAEACYRRAIELNPKLFDARNNLGLLLRWRGRHDDAEAAYLAILEEAPGFVDARQNIVALYIAQGRLRDAMLQAAAGLMTAPRNRLLRRLLGRVYADHDAIDKAIELYEKWAADDPDDPEPPHHLAALRKKGVPDRASDSYVVSTFAGFANTFDSKLAELEYRAPQLVGERVRQIYGEPQAALDVVDAGCGTGLCAPLLRPYARHLVGVDLTPQMLVRANERGGYDDLQVGELVKFLRERPSCCDLLVSADTLCYFGRIDEFAGVAYGALRPGGRLLFTVEAHEGEPEFRLYPHGRYSHAAPYVLRALGQAGLAEVATDEVVLRMERGQPVRGWLVHARR